jgi:sugar phosphate isomerase/epimerase
MASLVLLVAAVPNAAHAKAPAGFIGTNAEDVYAGDAAYQERMLTIMQAYGITVLRQNFRWGYSEPARGVFDWAQVDRFVLAAASHGIRVLPLLYGETPWATSRPAGNEDRCAYPPKKSSDFAAWVSQVVGRYGRTGTFWTEHPEAANQAMTAFEIWNEPNFKPFWKCKPNAKAYVNFARPAADAIRKLDPNALIISAGSPKIEKNPGKYFRDAFKAGAAKVFNAVGLHPYEPSADAIMKDLRDARKALDKNGAKNWSLVITEFGWASGGPKAEGKTVSESKQADLVRNSLKKMAKERKKLKIKSAIYYTWHDLPPAPGQDDFWGLHTGLLRTNDTYKPALSAVAQASKDIQ